MHITLTAAPRAKSALRGGRGEKKLLYLRGNHERKEE